MTRKRRRKRGQSRRVEAELNEIRASWKKNSARPDPTDSPFGQADFNKVGPTLKKSGDFGESKPTFEISGWISINLSGNVKNCLSFCKAGRKCKKRTEIQKVGLEITISVPTCQKSPGFLKFRTTLEKAGRKSKMRSDFENFRPEFSVSVRLFRMLDNFFEFRPAFSN